MGFIAGLSSGRFSTCGSCQSSWLARFGGRSCGGFGSFLAFRLKRLALHFAHLFFERISEINGGLAELSHQFPEAAGKLRELLRSKDNQDHDEKDDHMGNAQHCARRPSNRPVGIIERGLVTVKPEFPVWYNFILFGYKGSK